MADARTQLVIEYANLVHSIARKLARELDMQNEFDEFIAFGNQGLLEAHDRFDATRGVQFNSFAYYRIRGAMLDGIRRMSYLPRRAHAILRVAEAADHVLEPVGVAQSKNTTTDTAAEAASLDDALSKITASFVLAAVGQSEERAPESPEDQLALRRLQHSVHAALDSLPEKERVLMRGIYLEGRNAEDVAREMKISKSWASRMHARALSLLKTALSEK